MGLGDIREMDLVPVQLGVMISVTREMGLVPGCYILCYYSSDGVLMSFVGYQATCSIFKGKI